MSSVELRRPSPLSSWFLKISLNCSLDILGLGWYVLVLRGISLKSQMVYDFGLEFCLGCHAVVLCVYIDV